MDVRKEDYTVRLMDMEYGIHEQVIKASDGHHTILLNARDADNQRIKGYEHAIEHLRKEDFEQADVQKIETEAHLIEEQVPVSLPDPDQLEKKRRNREAAFERKWKRHQNQRKEKERLFRYDAFRAAESKWLDPDR